MLATLRQRRYLNLFGIVLVVAIVCIIAGTWQIFRFDEKRHANKNLRHNNRDVVTDVSTTLGPAQAPTANGQSDKFRHVTATGTYLSAAETLVRGQSVGDSNVGYLVITPLRTDHGVLLIARGFIPQTQSAADTPVPPSAPTGTVTVEARLEPASTRPDRLGALPKNQVEAVNPADYAARLGQPVWNAYAELIAGEPGTAGLTVIPNPDMSNPAGGAEEPQHAAYVVQWYLFAGLALALPFVLAAAERRRDDAETELRTPLSGPDPTIQPGSGSSRRERKAALDDRLAGRS